MDKRNLYQCLGCGSEYVSPLAASFCCDPNEPDEN